MSDIASELVVKLDNNSHIIRNKSETYLQRAFDLIVEADVARKSRDEEQTSHKLLSADERH